MKPSKLTLLPLAVAMFFISPVALAQNTELDMTMTIMEEGQGPEGFIQKLSLPSPEVVARDNISVENDSIADQVNSELSELTDETGNVVTDSIKDILSIDGVSGLPGDIVDNLSEDLPLLDDDLIDNLPAFDRTNNPAGDLSGELPQDMTHGVDDIINTIDNPADDIKDAGPEIDQTLEETKSLLP